MRPALLAVGLALAAGCTPGEKSPITGGGGARISHVLLLAKSNDSLLKDKNPSTVRVGERVPLRVMVSWTIPSVEDATSAASFAVEPAAGGDFVEGYTFVAKQPGEVCIKAEVRVQRGDQRDSVLAAGSPGGSGQPEILSDSLSLTVIPSSGEGDSGELPRGAATVHREGPEVEIISPVDASPRPAESRLKLDDPVLYSAGQLLEDRQMHTGRMKLVGGVRPQSDSLSGLTEVFGRRRSDGDWPLVQDSRAVWITGVPAPPPGVPVVVAGTLADGESGPGIEARHIFTDGGRIDGTPRSMAVGEYLFFALPGARSVVCPVELKGESVRIAWLDEMAGVVVEGVKPGKTKMAVWSLFRLEETPELVARFEIDVRSAESPSPEPSPVLTAALVEWQFPFREEAGLRTHPLQRRLAAGPAGASLKPALYPGMSEASAGEPEAMLAKLTRHAECAARAYAAGRENHVPPFLVNVSSATPAALRALIASGTRIVSFGIGDRSEAGHLDWLDGFLSDHREVLFVAAAPHISGNQVSIEELGERPSILAARGHPNLVLVGSLSFYEEEVAAHRAGQRLGTRENPFWIENQPAGAGVLRYFMLNSRSTRVFAEGFGATSAAAPHLASLLALIAGHLASVGQPVDAAALIAHLDRVMHQALAREKPGGLREVNYFTLDTVLLNARRPLVSDAIWEGALDAAPAPLRVEASRLQ